MFRRTARRFKPEPFWRDLIDRWKASGQSVAAFCAAHGVSQATFYAWRKRLAARARSTARTAPAFTAVRVVPDATAEVILPTGLVVRKWVTVANNSATICLRTPASSGRCVGSSAGAATSVLMPW